MTTAYKKRLIQSELNLRTNKTKQEYLIGKVLTHLIAGITVLSLLSSIQDLSEKNERTKLYATTLFLGWAFLRNSNLKTNAQNKMIYKSLNAHEETTLTPNKEVKIIKNVGSASITFGLSTLSVFIPILASQCNQLTIGTASCACGSILLAGETYIKIHFNKNNRLLKKELPTGISLPNLSEKQRG